jgi:GNAT superfamily N-acetyltransferase
MVERCRRSGREISARARQVIVVRAGVASDAPTLAALRWAFRAGRARAVEDQSAFIARCADWMQRQLQAADRWRCWVATRNQGMPPPPRSEIIGQVWLEILPKVPNPVGERDRHAYLSNLYVAPEARGGVGSRLLDAALGWADQHGVDCIVLWPTRKSTTLYERHGFVRPGEVMERKSGRSL